MARTAKPKADALGTHPREETGPMLPSVIPLTIEERISLRKIFNDPVFRKAFTNARLFRPSCVTAELNGPLGGQIANNRLHQQQGWEMFEIALARQVMDPLPPRKPLEESFPADPFFQSADPAAPEPAKPRKPRSP